MDIGKIEEIRKRVNCTTKGNWHAENVPYNGIDDPIIVTEYGCYVAQTVYDMQSVTTNHEVDEDTVFIANAKQDILYLLSIIDKFCA